MTAAAEQAQPAARCMAMAPPHDWAPALAPCDRPVAAWAEGRCRCGHPRHGWVCRRHAATVRIAGYLECITDPVRPHDCPLFLRLTPRRDVP